jgi:hypothetical protein
MPPFFKSILWFIFIEMTGECKSPNNPYSHEKIISQKICAEFAGRYAGRCFIGFSRLQTGF